MSRFNGALFFGPCDAVVIFLLVGVLSLSYIIPLAIGPTTTPVPQTPGTGAGTYEYLQTPCGCSNENPVAGVDYGASPTEREVSNQYFDQAPQEDIPDPRGATTFMWAWGQLVDHEIVLSTTDPNGTTISIPFDSNINLTMSTVLTRASPVNGCMQPKNLLAPMIDGSAVYSDYKDVSRMTQLRVSPTSCKLRLDNHDLPPIEGGNFFCGDQRCGEHAILTTLHTLLIREHNKWCDTLAAEHPEKSENDRYWWARALVVSIMQRITLEEWLPALLGTQAELLITVPVKNSGLGLPVEFTVQAFRFGHSMVANNLGQWPLTQLFFNNDFIRTNGVENVLHAAYTTPAQKVDTKIVSTLRNMLFGEHGMDLVAFNLFRNRQLGGVTYQSLIRCYGLTEHVTFPPGHPAHVDTLLALLSEPLVEGSSLPRTIATVVAETFRRLRDNDPNWYTRRVDELQPQYFDQISKYTLAKLIRRNTALSSFPGDAFISQTQ